MTDMEKFVSIFVGLIGAYTRPGQGRVLAAHLKALVPGTEEYWKTIGIGRKQSEDLLTTIAANKTTAEDGGPSKVYAQKLIYLYKDTRPFMTKFYQRRDINETQVKLLKNAIGLLTYDATTFPKKEAGLDAILHNLPDKLIKTLFIKEAKDYGDQKSSIDEIKMLVKKWTGKVGTTLPRDVAEKIKAKDPERFKHFQNLNKKANDTYKSIVRQVVRAAGKPLPIKQVIAALSQAGAVEKHPYLQFKDMPFLVNDNGLLVTTAGHEIKILPPRGSEVKYNTRYDPRLDNMYVFQYRPPNTTLAPGKWKQVYTTHLGRSRKEDRFKKVVDNLTSISKQRTRWVKDLYGTNTQRKILAAITECLYQHAARIGGKGETKGEATFGLSTLTMAHVKKTGDAYILSYPGKDAIPQKHVINSKIPEGPALMSIMNSLTRGKVKTDRLWTVKGKPVNSADVRAYLKGMGIAVSPHKFRHIRGSKLMQDLLAKADIPKSATQPQVEKIVKGLAVRVGELLGHVSGDKPTAMTSIKNYIVPQVFIDFFKSHDLRVPQWVPSAGSTGD